MFFNELPPRAPHDDFDNLKESLEWQMHVMYYCQEHYRETAQIVVAKIIDSDYVYGIDNHECRRVSNNWGDSPDDAWVFYRRQDERGKKEVYLTSTGLLRFDQDNGGKQNVYRQAYIPGVFDESPLEAASIYANLVGMVEEEDFREKHLAFLEG